MNRRALAHSFLALFCVTFFLVASHAAIHARDAQTALQQRLASAAARGDVAGARKALDAGAKIDARNGAGETALLVAAQNNHLPVFVMLLARGANINAPAQNKDTPWLLAGARGRTAMLAAMLDAAPQQTPDLRLHNRFGGTALTPACHYGHVASVRLLLARSKINVDQVNSLGWTCLLEAVILGDGGPDHQQIVKMALAAGANASLADRDGVTPLQHARQRNQTMIVRILESAGAK